MIPLPGASNRKKYIREDRFSFESKKQSDETYFPPQKIFVVITRLERLKMENESTSVRTSADTRRVIAK